MTTTINYNDDYSVSYRDQLSNAIVESGKLGFGRPLFISEKKHVSDESLRAANKLVISLTPFLDTILPGYWGNSCQTLSTNIFA